MSPLRLASWTLVIGALAVACTGRSRPPSPPPSDRGAAARLERKLDACRAGDDTACRSILHTYRGRALIDQEVAICKAAAIDRCQRAGRWLVEQGRDGEAREPFELGCVHGDARSCAGLAGLDLEDHHWVWECVALTIGENPGLVGSVAIPMTLVAGGPSTVLKVRRGVGVPAQLQNCLGDALEHTRFPPLSAAVEVDFEHVQSLDPLMTKIRTFRFDPHPWVEVTLSLQDDRSPGSCPPGAPAACQLVPLRAMRPIYPPLPTGDDLLDELTASAPRSSQIAIRYCNEDKKGHVGRIEVLDDGGAPRIAARMIEKMPTWRVRHAIVDGRRIPACSRIRLSYRFVWRVDQRPHRRGTVRFRVHPAS